MAFPSPPYTNGQTHTENGISYSYDNTKGVWAKASSGGSVSGDVPSTRTVTGSVSLAGGGDLSANRTLTLTNDSATPSAWSYYGTNSAGVKGWYVINPVQKSFTFSTPNSITGGGDLTTNRTIQLVNDSAAPGIDRYYGTNSSGIRGWQPFGPYVLDTRRIDTDMSLTGGGDLTANRTLSLVNDVASPGNRKYYGTDSSGVRGWYDAPQPLQFYGAYFVGQNVAVGGYIHSNGGSGNTITMTSNTTDGASFSLTANRRYHITVSFFPNAASSAASPLGIFDRTSNTAIVSSFIGQYDGFYTPTANVDIGVKLVSGSAISNGAGTFTIYTID